MSRYCLLGICLFWPLWLGVVEGRGEFTTIINVPPTTDVYSLGSNTQLNLFDGGRLPGNFSAGSRYENHENIEVNVFGGIVDGFAGYSGSTVNVSGGLLAGGLTATNGSTVNVSGGILHHWFEAEDGSRINLYGAEFFLNGQAVAGLSNSGDQVTIDWLPNSYLSGVLADGTPFVLAERWNKFEVNTLSLNLTELPEIGPVELTNTNGLLSAAIHGGQTLTINSDVYAVRAGAESTINHVAGVSSYQAIDAEVNVFGGNGRAEAYGNSVVNVHGGELWGSFHGASTVNVHAGTFGGVFYGGVINVFAGSATDLYAHDGEINFYGGESYSINTSGSAVANIHGGMSSGGADAQGGTINISGGSMKFARAREGGTLVISGGQIRESLIAKPASQVTLIGDEFVLDGELIDLDEIGDSIQVQVPAGSAISGILADGHPFAFSTDNVNRGWPYDSTDIEGGQVVLKRAALPTDNRTHLVASLDSVPLGLRQGQILTVDAGGVVGDFFGAGFGSIVNVDAGGEIGHEFHAAGAQVTVRGGMIGYLFDVSNGSIVEVDGGEILGTMDVFGGGTVNVRSGKVGSQAYIIGTGVLNVYGGEIDDDLRAFSGGTINIMGGTVGAFAITEGSTANISGGIVAGHASVSGTARISGGTLNEMAVSSGGMAVISGGAVIANLTSWEGASTAITGGTISNKLLIQRAATATIAGGKVDGRLVVDYFGQVDMSGGVIADGLSIKPNARFSIQGGDITLNGQAVDGLTEIGAVRQVELPHDYVLQGTLSDGTPFAFSSEDLDSFASGALWLEVDTIPIPETKHIVASLDHMPLSIRGDQHATVDQGGQIPDNFMMGAGSTLEVLDGGKVGDNLEVIGGVVHIRGGEVGRYLDAYGGSMINIEGGTVRERIVAHSGSQINVIGGSAGIPGGEWPDLLSRGILAKAGSELNISGGEVGGIGGEAESTIRISGGRIGPYAQSLGAANVTLSGGTIGDHFALGDGGSLTIKGDNFRIDGVPIPGLENMGDTVQISFETMVAYSGVLQDGTPFVFSHQDADYISSDALITLENAPVAPVGPAVITASRDPIPYGIRGGQQLVVDAGAVVGHSFTAGEGSVVDVVPGGSIGTNFEAIGATVNLNGGTIGSSSASFSGTVVNVNDGYLGDYFRAYHGSLLNIEGGKVGPLFSANEGSTVNVRGGQLSELTVYPEATVYVSGGTIVGQTNILNQSEMFIFGTEFMIDGLVVENLGIGTSLEIDIRDVTLSGTLAHGSGFEFYLGRQFNPWSSDWYDYFAPEASLYVTLVHNPGDYNGDLRVDDADLLVWQDAMLTGNLAADGNYDRLVNEADRIVWQETYGTYYGQVPEPAALQILAAISLFVAAARPARLGWA